VPATAIKPVQVKALKTFRQEFNWLPTVTAGEYNLLAEFFLTHTARTADPKVLEVSLTRHASVSMIRFASDRHLGTF
jgi:hypothetical protein